MAVHMYMVLALLPTRYTLVLHLQEQVQRSLIDMDTMLWGIGAMLRAETREVLASGNITNATGRVFVNVSAMDSATMQQYQHEFAEIAAANTMRCNSNRELYV